MKAKLLAPLQGLWNWMFRFETLGQTMGTVGRSFVLLVLTSLLSYCTYLHIAPNLYKPKIMANLSGQIQTQCVGRYLVDAPVELGRLGVNVAEFLYGLDSNFKTVEVKVKDEDFTPQQFFDATQRRIKELQEKRNRELLIPLLLAQEVWNTPNGKVLMLRYLKNEIYSFSQVNSEVHILVGARYAVLVGTSSESDYNNVKENRESYKYIDPKPMETRLLNVAQNIKGYSDATKAPEGFCMAGVVMNNKTMGYDVESAMFSARRNTKRLKPFNWEVDMEGQFPSDDRNLLVRIEETNKALGVGLALEGGKVNTIRSGDRKINGMKSWESAESLLYKGIVQFQIGAENAIPKEERSLLRPGFTVYLDFGDDDASSPVTQDEALKIWDTMIGSMRLSPANGGDRVEPETGQLTPLTKVGQVCPRAGIWEARLPASNPSAPYLASSRTRFVKVNAGDLMPVMYPKSMFGKTADADNAQVSFAWRQADWG